MQTDKETFYDTLYQTLDPRSGKIKPTDDVKEDYWKKVLDIEWKGNIHFIVTKALFRPGLAVYYVLRDGQLLSPKYYATKVGDELHSIIQHNIDDIENGKYRNKKTMRERIKALVEEKCLVSYMNNTKWHELMDAINEKAPDNGIQYKTLFEDTEPEVYWHLRSDEKIVHIDLAQVEWMKIRHTLTDREYIGYLVPDKVYKYDNKSVILEILQEYSIPYEYDESEQVFVVYGYK